MTEASGTLGPAVDIADIVYAYPGVARPALLVDRLTIAPGESVALIGTSGAGKSTLLRLVDGRLRGWTGSATVLGHALSAGTAPPRAHRRKTGFIFQEFALLETVGVFRNVMNGRLGHLNPAASLFGRYRVDDERAVASALDETGIDDLAGSRAENLSGGQRQRVAIARCLAQEPDLILADEPVSNLDPVNAGSILTALRESAARRGAAFVMSSHQPDLVANYVDRFVALEQGSIIYDGPADNFGRTEFAAVYGGAARAEIAAP